MAEVDDERYRMVSSAEGEVIKGAAGKNREV